MVFECQAQTGTSAAALSDAKREELRKMAEALRDKNARERDGIQKGFHVAPAKGVVNQAKICKAAIGAMMNRDPAIISVDSEIDGTTFLSYIRQTDNTRWNQKCKLSGKFVMWGTATGRWRDNPADERISYEITSSSVVIRQQFSDGGITQKSYEISAI